MFDLGMIESYVLNLREEGGKCLLSSLPDFSERDLEKMSLPFLSWCYFSVDDSEKKKSLRSFIQLDLRRKKSSLGSDIFRSNTCKLFLKKETTYQKALKLIRGVWPEYFEVIKIIKPQLSQTMVGDRFESASDPKIFGQILYRMDSNCPIKWAEIIIHELAHHYLNMVVTTHDDQNVFSQPWDETKYSAIRESERPLIGIYHGAFAEACMLSLALRIISTKKLDSQYRDAAYKMIEKISPLFKQDYQTAKQHKCLSFDEHITEIIESVRFDLESFEFKTEKICATGIR
ncbi:MAG: motif protein [Bacteriovoracaceae bacterium]|nr:motif protein [Bacteriovoracaceae bacterium]